MSVGAPGPQVWPARGHERRLGILGDSLYVVDTSNARLSVFTTAGAYERSVPVRLPGVLDMLVRSPQSLIVTRGVQSPRESGLPWHEIDTATGRTIRCYGDLRPVVNPLYPWLNMRAVTDGGSGTVWSARRTAYELERWRADGERLELLQRKASWFEPYVERPIGQPVRPPPFLIAIATLGDGLLLVAITRGAANFVELLGPRVSRMGRSSYDIGWRRLLYDTILEVIDWEQGAVLAHHIIDDFVIGFVPGSSVAYTYDERDGVPEVMILRVEFTSDGG